MTLCDTSFLLGLIDSSQKKHAACNNALPYVSRPLITTWPCLAEGMHLLGRRSDRPWLQQQQLAGLVLRKLLVIYQLRVEDYRRLFLLMDKYQDRPMDLADASLVVAAERISVRDILTLDSDFLFYRINDTDSFNVFDI
ncbi:MAG: PIN domain-containing protein [Cyanobacteria bacterium J06573_11]